MIIREELARQLEVAALQAKERGLLPPVALPEVTLEHPQNPDHGDYASSLPLQLARSARLNPLSIAQTLVSLLPPFEPLERVEVAAPGFINYILKPEWLVQQVAAILEAGEAYGHVELGQGQRVQVEYVSANPTGPLHVGNGRGAVLGNTLVNILKAAGYDVTQEYYINDAGYQVDAFQRSLYARYQQALGLAAELPSDGYGGEYLREVAREIIEEEGDRYLGQPQEERLAALGQAGLKRMLVAIQSDLEALGVHFDVWFTEQSLYQEGQYERGMQILLEKGYVTSKEGAQWFVSTALGEDKDNVLVRSTGAPTYLASDVAYHYNKFVERGFHQVIDIWGADHLGHVSRMKAVIAALGIEPERLQIIITQMVTLRRGVEVVRLSKRAGDIVTLQEVIEEVGKDACRFFFLSRSADSQMDFDLELAKRESAENPVYYVQYAHARIASILRVARERGIDWSGGDVSLLTSEPELSLIRKMLLLPELVELAARTLEPHSLPHYAQELATTFHSFYTLCRVISDDEALTHCRLKLVQAAKIVLAKTLALMGMSAPEKM